MKSRLVLALVLVAVTGMIVIGQTKGKQHLNPMVDLLQQHKPVFGIYAPSAFNLPGATAPQRGARGGRGPVSGPPPQEDPCGEADELAKHPAAAAALTAAEVQTQSQIAKLAMAERTTVTRDGKSAEVPVFMDYLFSGDFEGGVDQPLPRWTELMKGLQANGDLVKTPATHLLRPVMQKAPKFGCDPKKGIEN